MMQGLRSTRNCEGRSRWGRADFTLLGLLATVLILVILSALVVPEFTQASDGDRESRLLSELQFLRSQLELYRVAHEGEYPCGDPAAPVSPGEFVSRLTSMTTPEHETVSRCGPYLYNFPANPFNHQSSLRYVRKGDAVGTDGAGWAFDLDKMVIVADDAGGALDGKMRHCDL